MTFWLIAIPVVVVLAALVWWRSGHAKHDLRRRSIRSEVATREGSAEGFGIRRDNWSGGGGAGGL